MTTYLLNLCDHLTYVRVTNMTRSASVLWYELPKRHLKVLGQEIPRKRHCPIQVHILQLKSFPLFDNMCCPKLLVNIKCWSPFFQPPFYSRNTAEMYDNILNKPLQLKPNITNSARHLLEGLLQKDRTKRLGAKDDFVSVASCSPGWLGSALPEFCLFKLTLVFLLNRWRLRIMSSSP